VTPRRSRLAALVARDPVVLGVGLVALVTYALHGFHGALTRDLGIYSYAGQQVAEGVPPYLGVLNRAGPLAHAVPGAGVAAARLVGLDDVITMRVMFLVLAVLTVCVVYLLARDLFASRPAGLVAAGVFLTFHGFIHYATNGPREKTPMTLFIVGALWAVTRRWWFTAGVCISLATLCLQIAFFASFGAAVAAAVLLASGERLRALTRLLLGGSVPVAVCVVWFTVAGSLRESVEAFLLINARYTEPDPPRQYAELLWQDALEAYGLSLWLLIAGILVLLVRGLTAAHGPTRRREPSVLMLAALAVGAVTGLLWNLRDYDAWPDLFPMLPLAAVGIASLVPVLSRHAPRRTTLVVVGAVLAVTTGIAVQWSVATRSDTLVQQRAAVDEVVRLLPPDAAIASIEAPQPLVLTRRANWSRHQMFRGGLEDYVDDTWPGGRAGFARDLVAQEPDLVAVGSTTYWPWRAALESSYVCVGTAPGWLWYAPADLDPDRLTALREAALLAESGPCPEPVAETSSASAG
jgi:hypothetical protein